jgi:hypothetical protein
MSGRPRKAQPVSDPSPTSTLLLLSTARPSPSFTAHPLAEDRSLALSRIFRAIGDPMRLRLLSLIA